MRTSIRCVIVAVVALLLTSGGIPAARAQDGLDFDLSGDTKKKKKKKKKKPKKTKKGKTKAVEAEDMGLGFEALDVSVKSPEKEAMEKALDLIKDEKYDEAAVAFHDIYNNPRAKQYFQSAEYQIAKALYRMRMYHSALEKFGKILDKGVEHKYFKTSLEWLFFISHKITDQSEVLKDIARYSDIEFPKKYRDEFLFLLAKYFYFQALNIEKAGQPAAPAGVKRKDKKKAAPAEEFGFDLGGEEEKKEEGFGLDLEVEKKNAPTALPTDAIGFLSKAKALILQVSEKSKFHPRAKYLEGIILYKQGNFQEAVSSFKETVVILHPKKGKFRDDRLREKAFFQLARIHYEHKQFKFALFYYDRIVRDSEGWLESLFEASWSWFRVGKYEKSLGNLITLDSPFFREEYFPEGLVLKAVTYYENCRYPESNQIVAEFRKRYAPLHKELERLLAKGQDPVGYYKQLLAIQKAPPRGSSGKLLRRILKVALSDKDLKLLNASVLEIEKEIQRIRRKSSAFSNSKLAAQMIDGIQKRKDELMKDAGLLTKRRLEAERDFLSNLMSQALRIKLENDQAELEVLRKVQAGEMDLGPTLLPYDWSAATDDEKIYWPYQGEYWRDELGTYEYTLTWGCRKNR
jgi:outer membrane protein assembly factor BamD (BamD/ComL family)